MKQSTYRNLRAQQYDIGTDSSQIIAFYLAMWERLGKPTPVLEPMCGTGINTIPFLERGIEADGLDSSPYMLAAFEEKCVAKGLACHLYEQFVEKMAIPKKYGFIFIPGGSLGHIYEGQLVAQSLQRVYEHLLPGGWLVLDVRPPTFFKNFGKDGEFDFSLDEFPDGSTVFTTGCWQHLENGRVIRKWNKLERFVDDTLVETEVFDYRERMFEITEMEGYLKNAGFNQIELAKAYDYNLKPEGSNGIVFICQRTL
jgi:SAM-dependent methyltransferase